MNKPKIISLTIEKALDISEAKTCPHCLREIASALEKRQKNVFRVDGDWHVFDDKTQASHLAKRLKD